MTNQTPKQEVDKLIIDAFVRDVTKVGSMAKSEVKRRLKAILAEHRKMVVEECLAIIDGEKWTEVGLLKSSTIQEEGMRLHRNQVCDDLTYAVSALLNTKDDV